jgi:3-hydroxyisobutyrate dehydrogenase-like beta-hydroxyacid dehydrogenase
MVKPVLLPLIVALEEHHMSDMTIIGVGKMGFALARSLLSNGYNLTLWNRTRSKAEPLVAQGAVLEDDLAAAVRASPILVVCVINYEVTYAILSEPQVRQELPGKVMLQLSSGTPIEADESERWAHNQGMEYLSGEIMVGPDQIGTPSGGILVAGEESVYQRFEPLLRTMAARTVYLGRQVGAPLAYGWAMGAVLFSTLLGTVLAAQICEVEGIDLQLFASRLAEGDMETIASMVQETLKRIQNKKYDESQAMLSVAADGVEHLLAYAKQRGLYTELPEYFVQAFSQAIDAGLGAEDMAAMIKVWRGEV